ncbi:hypothetical protein HK099_000952 [Clydaea vesicula]|uniref:protein xylosyltransferase n=1 Tax=Clydaea vesicula TaxID=447962 RepID=A0AAD5TUS3_9FUNG|nr:hypothetical protein HK099_000952 [Clydaea vesicula]
MVDSFFLSWKRRSGKCWRQGRGRDGSWEEKGDDRALGFFELADIADWDYVVNLSANDYTLRSPKFVYKYLQTTNPKKLWINFLKETREEKLKRLESPYLMLPNKSGLKEEKFDIFLKPKRNFFLKNDFFPVKHSQWMILTKEFIDFIRTDQKVLLFLAWTEHTWVSDEFFFGMVALYSHPDKIINDNKRFINFKDKTEKHPIWLNYNTSSLFLKKTTNFTKDNNQNNFFWFRKVKISQDIDLKNAVDLERNLADLSLT